MDASRCGVRLPFWLHSVLSTQYLVLSTKYEKRRSRREEQRENEKSAEKRSLPVPASRQTFRISVGCSLLGGLLLWASFPPLNLWPIAWAAPLPWLYLVLRPQPMTRWAYFGIWLGSCVHWLLMLQGIRLANLLLYPGWIILSAYLAIYLPFFVGLCRVAICRKISMVVAAPVVWVGLELARGYVATGFSAGLLSHSQTDWSAILQIADICGAYGVSFLMMLVAASTGQILFASRLFVDAKSPREKSRSWEHDLVTMFGPLARYWSAIIAAPLLSATLLYGYWRLTEKPPGEDSSSLKIALIQGSRDVHIDMTEQDAVERMEHYIELTDQARRENSGLDLVIWPESMFALPEVVQTGSFHLPREEVRAIQRGQQEFRSSLVERAAALNPGVETDDSPHTHFWFCTTTFALAGGKPTIYNTAILADENGQIISRYHKMHAVMFGEYIPFAGWFPWIYDVIPIGGMTEGDKPVAARVKELAFSPSICFESTVPHLIRKQVLELKKQGTPPDVLVNLTNDGWFHGSSILDLHLRCGIYRAIENRRPLLIAANTGISAHIDGSGRMLVRGPKRQPQILVANVQPDGRTPLYHTVGDWPAWACLAASSLLLVVGLILRRRDQKSGIERSTAHESERTALGK